MQGNSREVEQLLASQDTLCSVELVSHTEKTTEGSSQSLF
jgi:hypothetical protein